MKHQVAHLHETSGAIYLCGPMTGMPEHGFPAFDAAAAELRVQGFEVISPAELDEDGVRRMKMTGEGIGIVSGDANWARFLIRDVKLVADAAAVVVLPGWQRSRGARLEVETATALAKPVYEYPSLEEIPARKLQRVELRANIRREFSTLAARLKCSRKVVREDLVGLPITSTVVPS